MTFRPALFASLLTLPILLLSSPAQAEDPPQDSADFSPFMELLLLGFDDFALDTGWIPANSPVQMRFYASASNSVTMSLPGQAIYDWGSEELHFVGTPMAGSFDYQVGLELFAGVKVDVNLIQWESDLLGPYDWLIDEEAVFTPYLLEGNPERPAAISETSDAFPLASVPLIPDIVVLSGNLDIDLFVDIQADFQCERIEVQTPGGELVDFTNEGEAQLIDPGEGPDDLVLPATAYCRLRTAPTLIVNPHLVMEVAFQEFDIAGIDIPIDLPVVDDELQFDTIELSFPRWEAPTGDTGGETGTDGGSETDTDTAGDSGDEVGLSGGEIADDGCNCSSASADTGRDLGGTTLALLGLLAWRRRRD
ncbi:MAG: MYXO-CTERM sorting domain-containing protein [Myxococcales bacterium]|nr:MYXO-CTERM sorting domain-containing protein [Myxococcales bacterium]